MTKRAVKLDEAAAILGTSKDAVRKRIKRGTIEAEKDSSGRWKVIVDQDVGEDAGQYTGGDASMTLVDAMQREIDFLRKELERKDHIIMALSQKIPQLEAPKKEEDQESGPRSWWRRLWSK